MSDTVQADANVHQNTPSATELEDQITADEAARHEPEAVEPEVIEPEPELDAKPEEDSDYQKRISRLAFEKRTAEKEARALREKLARLEGKAPALPKDEEVIALVEERAAALAAEKMYNDKAEAIYQAGVKEFPDFHKNLGAFRDIGGLPPVLVEAADEVGDAHRVINYLAKNIDEAERVIGLPAHKMGAALAKIGARLAAPVVRPQSKAPAPIKPVAGHGNAEVADEDMPIDEYMRREDERWAMRRYRH